MCITGLSGKTPELLAEQNTKHAGAHEIQTSGETLAVHKIISIPVAVANSLELQLLLNENRGSLRIHLEFGG